MHNSASCLLDISLTERSVEQFFLEEQQSLCPKHRLEGALIFYEQIRHCNTVKVRVHPIFKALSSCGGPLIGQRLLERPIQTERPHLFFEPTLPRK